MKKDVKELDFGKGFAELQEITAWFEKGETDLDEGVKKFERAVTIAGALRERMTQAENKMSDMKVQKDF